MPVTVRIRNVQSIRDATLRVEGFTVVTGPNNCGKTASQRAVRGVFTNASPGPLVRHGENHLTVDLAFDDGRTVKWEKGEKVNRYTVDGKVLSTVGRGVPPEVTALGVGEIKAGSDRLWPQIAEQFGGVLFLVDRPGSVVAEALSDVDKVGRLTEALRLAESDKRSVGAELKVRRADVLTATQEVAGFDALPEASLRVTQAEQALAEADKLEAEAAVLLGLAARKSRAAKEITHLSAAPLGCVPTPDAVDDVRRELSLVEEVARLRTKYLRLKAEVGHFAQVRTLVVPETRGATLLLSDLGHMRGLFDRLSSARTGVEQAQRSYAGATAVGVPSPDIFTRVSKAGRILAELATFSSRLKAAGSEVAAAMQELNDAEQRLATLTEEVGALLGDRGECPVCRTPCVPGTGGHEHTPNG